MELTDEQWGLVEPLIPKGKRRPGGKGRPPRETRDVLNGVLWVLRTGAPWQDIPERYPPYQTCHRYFQQWVRAGVLESVLTTLAKDLRERGGIDVREAFIDGSFAGAKKGAPGWARPSGARGARSWPLQTALVFLSPLTWPVLRRMKSL